MLPGSGELGARVLDVWITVLVCQSLVVEPGGEEGAPPVYQARAVLDLCTGVVCNWAALPVSFGRPTSYPCVICVCVCHTT